jgi:thiol:disulfide interchange protein
MEGNANMGWNMSRFGSLRVSAGRWFKNPSVLVPALIVGFVLMTQWPMLKGVGYRVLGISAPADTIPWRTDFAAALAESRTSGKPLLLDFSASWCPPCQVMKHDVWPDPAVNTAVTANYIPVFMDADSPATQDAARRYQVETIPRIIVVDADGKVLKDGTYMSRSAMLDFLAAH